MIITISGLPGSGKSTVGKILAKKLGYCFLSMGDFRGKMAIERGLTIDELNKLGENEDWTDKLADDYQKKLGETKDNIVIEGRMSFHFIPKSFKIFVKVDAHEAAKRTMQNKEERPDEKAVETAKEAEVALLKRRESDKRRYLKHYGIDYTNPTHYNLVIDSTFIPAKEVANKILDKIKETGYTNAT